MEGTIATPESSAPVHPSADAPIAQPPRQPNGLDSLAAAAEASRMGQNPTAWIHETPSKSEPAEDDEPGTQNDSFVTSTADPSQSASLTAAQSRKVANGSIGSVYSGNKIKHLKKEDGVPLWRKDIQFAFLRAVFEDTTPVFTSFDDGSKGHSFADIYISAMAKSSKCSKVLRDKLLSDRAAALNMAMICLLVNVGRMNTTLNFFPEMRAQLRTYHAIPCLQAHQDPNSAYKGLQDAPRLKSILKGATEDNDQPNTVDKIQTAPVPRTNPVNLVFVLSNYAQKVSETHFFQPRDFFDLIIRHTLSSKSRAKAFLWLLWWYLESDFSDEAALNNPFGPGLPGEEPDTRPLKVPEFEYLDEIQANAENVDSKEEQDYGWKMKEVRKRILENDEDFGPAAKKSSARVASPRLKDEYTDSPARSMVGSRSPSPAIPSLNPPKPRNVDGQSGGKRGAGRTPFSLKGSGMNRNYPSSSPAPPGPAHSVFSTLHGTPHSRRNRPETTHQRAVHANKQMRIASILHQNMRGEQEHIVKRNKNRLTGTFSFRALTRIMAVDDGYDTEADGSYGPAGLVPTPSVEEDDFGAEATKWKKLLNRVNRRMSRKPGDRPVRDSLADLSSNMNGRKRKHDEEEDDDGHINDNNPRLKRIKSEAALGRRGSPLGMKHMDSIDRDLLGEGDEQEVDMEDDDMGSGSDDTMDDADDDMND